MRALAVALLWLLATALPVQAQDLQPVPPLSGRVIDRSATLSEPQQQALAAKLAALEAETGSQVVVLLVTTTAPEDIAAYAHRVADQWKLGRREVGDGLLIVSAQADRRIRIEVAKTLEGAIPDLAAKRIIDERITPAFRAGDFAGGLNAGIDAIGTLIRGESLPPVKSSRGQAGGDGFDLESLAMIFFIGVPVVGGLLSAVMGRTLGSLTTAGAVGGIGWWLTSSLLLAGVASVLAVLLVGVLGVGAAGSRRGVGPIIWGGGLGGGGRGGWGGGGGFGSGGGGDFGGGGASGNW
ncbi:TPM domain-containing protein [Piscinibacter sakaiensis]|uniref:TPM domain-containing protein n=1 Tax=Piscinibacter sakaiensis TaxID=1547922 RepID=UPI003AAC468E